jgi:hypothetical protein
MSGCVERSFISALIKKTAFVIGVAVDTGANTEAAQKEAWRQIGQSMRGGDPIRGEGVTKSNQEYF